MDWGEVENSKSEILFGKHGDCVLQAKEKREHLACFNWTVQKQASISAHGIMGNLSICEGTINAKQYLPVWSKICSQADYAFFRDSLAYFN